MATEADAVQLFIEEKISADQFFGLKRAREKYEAEKKREHGDASEHGARHQYAVAH